MEKKCSNLYYKKSLETNSMSSFQIDNILNTQLVYWNNIFNYIIDKEINENILKIKIFII